MANKKTNVEEKYSKTRSWHIVINNPQNCGFNHDKIKQVCEQTKIEYYCMADEISDTGTYHTHLYIYRHNAIRFSTLQNKFNKKAHIEPACGNAKQNRDYILKQGTEANKEKKHTQVDGTFEEYGDMPSSNTNKKISNKELAIMLIDRGYTNERIIREYPQLLNMLKEFNLIRETLLFEKYKEDNREDLKIYYICGESRSGKSYFVRHLFGNKNVYCVDDYRNPFDFYTGQPVVLFEEFRSKIDLDYMLELLDIYPVQLKSRYSNKWACYKYVFVISNWQAAEQYPEIKNCDKIAFYKRFKCFLKFSKLEIDGLEPIYNKIAYKDVNMTEQCPLPTFEPLEPKEKEEVIDETKSELDEKI